MTLKRETTQRGNVTFHTIKHHWVPRSEWRTMAQLDEELAAHNADIEATRTPAHERVTNWKKLFLSLPGNYPTYLDYEHAVKTERDCWVATAPDDRVEAILDGANKALLIKFELYKAVQDGN